MPKVARHEDPARFLSPEQQHLLRVRRDVERREAKVRRSLAGLALAAAGAVAAAIAWSAGWI